MIQAERLSNLKNFALKIFASFKFQRNANSFLSTSFKPVLFKSLFKSRCEIFELIQFYFSKPNSFKPRNFVMKEFIAVFLLIFAAANVRTAPQIHGFAGSPFNPFGISPMFPTVSKPLFNQVPTFFMSQSRAAAPASNDVSTTK